MADMSIWANALRPPKSIADYDQEAQTTRANALGLQSKQVEYENALRAQRDDAAYREAARGFGADPTQNANSLYRAGLPAQAAAVLKSGLEAKKMGAETTLATAHAGNFEQQTAASKVDQAIKASEQHLQLIPTLQTHDDAVQWAMAHRQIPGSPMASMPSEQFVAGLGRIPTDPAGLAQWKQQTLQGGVSATEQLKAKALAEQQAAALKETARGHDLTYRASQEGHAVSRANNRDTIAAENLRAGVLPGGGLDDNAEKTAQAIANGQLQPPSGMALLNPKNQRILGRVMEINPQYDSTTVTAKRAAATAFTTGKEGAALRSVATANAHLDQMGELVDALGNKDTQVINRVGNWYQAQTGNPAPTNFDAIKNVVGQEVVKAIVAGGGGVGEREEAAKAFSTAKSPAQLKGAIQHYRMIMGAQQENLLQQRDAAGLPRSTLPNYSKPSDKPAASTPAASTNAKGWTLHQDARGNKAYVSPDGKQFEEVK